MNASLMGKSACAVIVSGLFLAGCTRPTPAGYQGYLEGEFLYIAAPLAGQLQKLAVRKGARVDPGTPLFALEQGAELATLRESAERLRQSQARLADLRKGSRPSELAALEARQPRPVPPPSYPPANSNAPPSSTRPPSCPTTTLITPA